MHNEQNYSESKDICLLSLEASLVVKIDFRCFIPICALILLAGLAEVIAKSEIAKFKLEIISY